VQVDYQLPVRFDLQYTGADNKPHRPVMIHRAPFGSMERFIGVLIEHFAGAFPLWLSPVQVAVLSISEKTTDYASRLAQDLKDAGLRVEANLGPEKIGAKIREAIMAKTPYMLTVGEREMASAGVDVRPYFDVEGNLKGAMPFEQFKQAAKEKIASKWHPIA
jgi:threonyl-tRNA synthetase